MSTCDDMMDDWYDNDCKGTIEDYLDGPLLKGDRMGNEMKDAIKNTDKEVWREDKKDPRDPDNYYSPSVHITIDNKIGINSGGSGVVANPEQWI